MAGTTQTGAFWICPDCRKHVPARVADCRCGFKRGSKAEPEATVRLHHRPDAADEREKPNYLRTATIVTGTAGLAALILYMSAGAWWRGSPKDTALARLIRERREAPQQPSVVYVPIPGPLATSQPGTGTASPSTDVSGEVLGTAPVDEPVRTVPILQAQLDSRPAPMPVSEAVEAETETDRQRKLGMAEFERAMVRLAAKADQADIAWERYLAGCRENITTATSSAVAVAGAANRDWIGFVGVAATSSVTVRTWTEACAEAGAFFALADQVRVGMCVAEDLARRSSVYPGVRRDVRTKYRLDWSGWDTYCR